MNMPYTDWLPEDALRSGTVPRALAEVAMQWSQHWFARRLMDCFGQPTLQPKPAAGGDDEDAYFHPLGIATTLSPGASFELASMMLDAPLEEPRLTAADRWLARKLSEACLDDLRMRLGEAFGQGRDIGWIAGQVPDEISRADAYALGTSEAAPLVQISVTRPAAAGLVKISLPAAPEPAPLQPLATALARQPVRVSAFLGRCGMSLGEFNGLSAGDVVVLDRLLKDPVELAVDDSPTAAECTIGEQDGRLNLNLLKSLSG